jgi:hypothetical protein
MMGHPTPQFSPGPIPPHPVPSSPIHSDTDCFELVSALLDWVILQKPFLEARVNETRSLYEEQCYDLNGLKKATPHELKEIGIPIGLHKQIVEFIRPFMKSRPIMPSSTPPSSSQ